jgi:hypothetical protein
MHACLLGRSKIDSLRNPLTTVYQQSSTHNIRIIIAVCSASFLDIFNDMKDHTIQCCMVIADGVTGNIQRCASAWGWQQPSKSWKCP